MEDRNSYPLTVARTLGRPPPPSPSTISGGTSNPVVLPPVRCSSARNSMAVRIITPRSRFLLGQQTPIGHDRDQLTGRPQRQLIEKVRIVRPVGRAERHDPPA